MRDKIAEVVEKSWEAAMNEWALDISVDPPEYGHVAADAVLGLLRQGPQIYISEVECLRDEGYDTARVRGPDETRGWLTVKHPVSTAPYALVLLPEDG